MPYDTSAITTADSDATVITTAVASAATAKPATPSTTITTALINTIEVTNTATIPLVYFYLGYFLLLVPQILPLHLLQLL